MDLDYPDRVGRVLVHRGELLEDKGLEALGRYLGDIDLPSRRDVTVEELVALLVHLEALPLPDRWHQQVDATDPTLRPVVDWQADGVRLVLSYLLPAARAQADPCERILRRCTLLLAGRGTPRWSEESSTYRIG